MPQRNSGKKFVYYTFTNPATGKVVSGDMNWWEWERLQKDKYRAKDFKLDSILDMETDKPSVPVASGGMVMPLEIEEDPLECPLCGEVAEDDEGLLAHKKSKHGPKKQSVRSKDKADDNKPK